jgi:hypothetical protein
VHTLVSVGVGTGESGRGSILATHPTVRWWVGTYRQKAGAVQLPGEEGAECRGCRGWSSKSLCVEHRGAGGVEGQGPARFSRTGGRRQGHHHGAAGPIVHTCRGHPDRGHELLNPGGRGRGEERRGGGDMMIPEGEIQERGVERGG